MNSVALVSTAEGGITLPAQKTESTKSSGGGGSAAGAIAGGIIGGIVAGFLLLLCESLGLSTSCQSCPILLCCVRSCHCLDSML